jgi:hypothetical protein
MSACPNCKKALSCGCQKTKASDGSTVCKNCKTNYEKSINTNTSNSNIQNLNKFVK